MAENLTWTCHVCNNVGFDDGSMDGFFYCQSCGSQAEDIIQTGVAAEDFVENYLSAGHRRNLTLPIKAEPISQVEPSQQFQSQFWESLLTLNDVVDAPSHPRHGVNSRNDEEEMFQDGIGPTVPMDFGSSILPSSDEFYSELRIRYVMGIQLMIQMQCDALVEKFQVNPLIRGLSATIWLRFIASTGIFADGWANKIMEDSETQKQDSEFDSDSQYNRSRNRSQYAHEPFNLAGNRAVIIWYRSMRKTIPLSCSLAICFLCCHLARESVLPTDFLKWSLEGKLPYFAAYLHIEKEIGPPSHSCPLSSSLLFWPSNSVPLQKLESLAASIAKSISLELPPVNFHGIASCYMSQLSVPHEKILSHASRINDWAMSPDLWLSTSDLRLPTRVCVMSILIVAIRILYDLHGLGSWEKSLTSDFSPKSEFDSVDLLHSLEESFNKIDDTLEYSNDLPSYLKYCKDVMFAGLSPPFEDHEEEKIIKQLWHFYQNQKDPIPGNDVNSSSSNISNNKRCRDNEKKDKVDLNEREESIRRLKIEMEENRFCYIPPRETLKRLDYLQYIRKASKGSFTYVAHADYYILVRACARLAHVDVRVMHMGVLSFERRLKWLESRIRHCLHLHPPPHSCHHCGISDPPLQSS